VPRFNIKYSAPAVPLSPPQEKGFTVQVATLVLLLFGLGGGVGIIAGGAAGQLLYNWRKEAMPVMAGACIMLGVAPVYYLINVDLQAAGVPATLAMAALAGAVVSVAAPNLRAAMLNVNGGPRGTGSC
jgi:hypothetical protein